MVDEALKRSVLTSGTFRFALLFAAVFALGSLLVLITVQRQIGDYASTASDLSLRGEAAVLEAEYRQHGPTGLREAIARHTGTGKDPQFRYRLVDGTGTLLVGDLPADARLNGPGTLYLRERHLNQQADDIETFRTLGVPLDRDMRLVVATDTFDIRALMERLQLYTLASGIAVTLLALAGGYFVGSLFMRRLHGVNVSVNRIMSGSLDERLPAIGMGPEFDALSRNLNLMLDRIGVLMEAMRQVSTDIAHDLRTPLTRLRQQLEAARDLNTPQEYDARINAAVDQIDEILGMFRALLRIGSLEGGAGRGTLAPLDISEVMERVCSAYEPVVEDAGKRLSCTIEPGLTVPADAELLAMAVTNLIENALAHTPAGTRIGVCLTGTREGVTLDVTDDGPGIPEAEREKVLQRFYRLDASRSTPGSGLGLALVRGIATLHRATLNLQDNGPGLRVSLIFGV